MFDCRASTVTVITTDEFCKQALGLRERSWVIWKVRKQFALQLKVTNCFVCFEHSIQHFQFHLLYFQWTHSVLNREKKAARFFICCIITLMPLSDDHFSSGRSHKLVPGKASRRLARACVPGILKLQIMQHCHNKEEAGKWKLESFSW